jgi:hypothetical protein
MKTKLSIIATATVLVLTVYFISLKLTANQVNSPPKIALNFIKCTSAKFLLSGIDTTKQISPLFENLGNHTFTINTTRKMAQTFFD